MKILGLTGDIASGKSSVARLLGEKGAAHLDADLLVRELYANRDFAAQLAAQFGDVLAPDGTICREKLAPLVFGNEALLHELEAIVYPAVAQLRAQKLRELEKNGAKWVVLEAVKLLESGQSRVCDEVWCVVASRETQLRRLIENRDLSVAQAQSRLRNQPPRERKIELAGSVPLRFVENNGTFDELKTRVAALWADFAASAAPRDA